MHNYVCMFARICMGLYFFAINTGFITQNSGKYAHYMYFWKYPER